MRRSLLRLQIPLKAPFVTSGGVVAARDLAVIRLEDDDGTVGWGEAAPLEPYDGISLDEVNDAFGAMERQEGIRTVITLAT